MTNSLYLLSPVAISESQCSWKKYTRFGRRCRSQPGIAYRNVAPGVGTILRADVDWYRIANDIPPPTFYRVCTVRTKHFTTSKYAYGTASRSITLLQEHSYPPKKTSNSMKSTPKLRYPRPQYKSTRRTSETHNQSGRPIALAATTDVDEASNWLGIRLGVVR